MTQDEKNVRDERAWKNVKVREKKRENVKIEMKMKPLNLCKI